MFGPIWSHDLEDRAAPARVFFELEFGFFSKKYARDGVAYACDATTSATRVQQLIIRQGHANARRLAEEHGYNYRDCYTDIFFNKNSIDSGPQVRLKKFDGQSIEQIKQKEIEKISKDFNLWPVWRRGWHFRHYPSKNYLVLDYLHDRENITFADVAHAVEGFYLGGEKQTLVPYDPTDFEINQIKNFFDVRYKKRAESLNEYMENNIKENGEVWI